MRAVSFFRSIAFGRSSSFAARPLFCALNKPFSTTPYVKAANAELASQLSKEIEYEKENAPQVPDLIKEFKAKSGWVINEEDGKKEIIMTKTIGSETVKIFISTDAVSSMEDAEDVSWFFNSLGIWLYSNCCCFLKGKPERGLGNADCPSRVKF